MSTTIVGRVHVLVRVWLPDRPGALGLVASRIGAIGGDIVGVDVLERSGAVAVDEFAVELPDADLLPLLVREIEEVDGASVEELRQVDEFPDPGLDALGSAIRLCAADDASQLSWRLTDQTCTEFVADWSVLLDHREIVALAGDAPSLEQLEALAAGTAASPLVASGEAGPDDLAVATIPERGLTLLVGRAGHPFRRRERAQLLALARVAGHTWDLLEHRPADAPRRTEA
jgi:hypothetical protein